MGNGVLLLGRELRGGLIVPVGQEERIVAETVFPARGEENAALDRAAGAQHVPVREGAADGGDEARGALFQREIAELFENEVVAVLVRILVVSGIARGMDAWRAAERHDFQPRIIRNDRAVPEPGARRRLLGR